MLIGAPVQSHEGEDADDSTAEDAGAEAEAGEPIPLPERGDELTFEITLPDGIRRFTSVVDEITGSRGIRLDWPSSAERIQRRDYVRIDCFLETEVTFGEMGSKDERAIDARTTDVSGGGARLTMTEAPEPETRLHLRIKFTKTLTQDYTARVVRTGELDSSAIKQQFWVAVEFMDMTEARRNEIAKFIFDKEREQRRKGVA